MQFQNTLFDSLRINYINFLFFLFAFSVASYKQTTPILPVVFPTKVEKHFIQLYGNKPLPILDSWLQLIKNNQELSDWEKLHLANDFFNRNIKFIGDLKHWRKNDYWATPVEFIGTQGGDCEDFAIAKFFTLTAMGVDSKRLRLMYAQDLAVNQAHMVLIYSQVASAIPLVLDNINNKILPANQRHDLQPMYTFNIDGVWQANANGIGREIVSEGTLSRWQDLLTRIENGALQSAIN